jgi:flagellar biosynthetic protein FlhB
MGGQDSSQEKTEEATPKRLRDARKKGQVAKSKDMNTIVLLIVAFSMIVALRGFMGNQLKGLAEAGFEVASRKDLTTEYLFLMGKQTFYTYVKVVAPFVGVFLVVAFMVGFFQIGPIFSGEPLKPQVKRLNIVDNVKNMFKVKTLVELLKNIVKLSLIFLLAYMVVSDSLREVVSTVEGNIDQGVAVASKILVSFLVRVFIVFIAVAIIDVFVQRWDYKKQMRMTKDEVKREYKQDEGDPLIKSARRQLHQELAMGDVRQQVATSDAVVTNPVELAIAVKYDDREMMAPQVMAKGQRQFAELIKGFAKEAAVPIIENPPLAWTLIELEIGDEIPEELYTAIAEILVTVYRMKEEQEPEGQTRV